MAGNLPPLPIARDTSRDGRWAKIQSYFLGHFGWAWRRLAHTPILGEWANRYLIGLAAKRAPARPHPLTTMHNSEYTSWDSLSDRTWNARHLPPIPAEQVKTAPDVSLMADLFTRTGPMIECRKSTALFPAFAQWFTDGFLRTNPKDPLRNFTSHEVDLCQLYGGSPAQSTALRTRTGGRLKTQSIRGEEYAEYLIDPLTMEIKPEFAALQMPPRFPPDATREQKLSLFAFGGERANTVPMTAMINTLFLREHNRVAGSLEKEYGWTDDERLFQTSRNILIVALIQIVVGEYINHISPYRFPLRAIPSTAWRADWNRANWMTAEFNLLYRWHSAVPDSYPWPTGTLPAAKAIYDNAPLTEVGLGPAFAACSRQPAGQIGLRNTPGFLIPTELASIRQGRLVRLARYNAYRRMVGYEAVDRFEQITGDPERLRLLKRVYNTPDEVEFFVALFAEDPRPNAALPAMMSRLVAHDAFTQAFTNPLLAPRVFNAETFSPLGMQILAGSQSLQDLLNRNTPTPDGPYTVSMTRADHAD